MSGMSMVIERMMDHDYSGIATGANASLQVILAEVDVSQYREGTLEVLVNSVTLPAGASLAVLVYAAARTTDDAGKMYVDTASAVASVTITNSVTNPALYLGEFSANFGSTIAIVISASAVSTGTGDLKGKFETRLSLKN